MEFIEDITENRSIIEETIKKYGYAPEHNFYWYQYCGVAKEYKAPNKTKGKNIFVKFEDDAALLTFEEGRERYVFSEPLARADRRAAILLEYIENVLKSEEVEKVILELRRETRGELLRMLPAHFKARPINYTLSWPVMNIGTFDLQLPGGHYKHIRQAKSKFYREHTVAIQDARSVPKSKLQSIVESWRKRRGGRDRATYRRYVNLIENDFKGTESARVFVVDGRVCGLNAGWPIPNSRSYYGAIGLHDYSLQDLGLMLYLEDLEWLKKTSYSHADMGGGEKGLTNFKKQFGPESIYKTHVFSVVRRARQNAILRALAKVKEKLKWIKRTK